MNRKEKLAAVIQRNRFALLLIVSCWLLALYVLAADCLVIAMASFLAGRDISIPQAMPQQLAFASALDARTLQRRLLRIKHKLLNLPKYARRLIHRAKLQCACAARNAVRQASAAYLLANAYSTALTVNDLSDRPVTRPP